MTISRRSFLAATLAAAAGSAAPMAAEARGQHEALRQQVLRAFERLPGRRSLKNWMPRAGALPAWSVERAPLEAMIATATTPAPTSR